MLSGISFEGNTFFYPNVLEFDGKDPFNQGATGRKPWFDCSCCPSNISRFIPAVPGYFYAQKNNEIYVNLFASNSISLPLSKTTVEITQETNYPWEGDVTFKISVTEPTDFTLRIRIPGWAKNNPVPGDLYAYTGDSEKEFSLSINGGQVNTEPEKGYVKIEREWVNGDVVELNLPMQVRKVISNEKVKEISGKVAIERGPIVYCAEQADNPEGVLDLTVGKNENFKITYTDELNGIVALTSDSGIRMIPYYAWSHRGLGEMEVWFNLIKASPNPSQGGESEGKTLQGAINL